MEWSRTGKQTGCGGGTKLGASRYQRSSAPGSGHAHRGISGHVARSGGGHWRLGEDGDSEEGFPAEAGGLGIPSDCKCPRRVTIVGSGGSRPLLWRAKRLLSRRI